MREQIDRMQHIVDHQLRRAAAAGSRTLSEPVALAPLAEKIRGALSKVYASKQLSFDLKVPASLRLRADEGDLYELLGNLLDNACKWARSKVSLQAEDGARRVIIAVDDDGKGFPEDVEALAQRGVRADNKVEGQGIGLASVAELVKAYNGEMQLLASPLGGSRVQTQIPT